MNATYSRLKREFDKQMAQDNDVWRIELKGKTLAMSGLEAFLRGRRAGMEQMLELFEVKP